MDACQRARRLTKTLRRGGFILDNISHISTIETLRAPAPETTGNLEVLTKACADDLLRAFGLRASRAEWSILETIARVPARRLARQVMIYDQIVGEAGLRAGGAWALEQMARSARVEGRENVPDEGPLLLVSNHPGLADAVALFAASPREDLRVVAAKRPLLECLPNTSRRLISVTGDPASRLGVVRAASRHLRSGGAVLTFPGGRIEPDPAILPGAIEALGYWSQSVNLFARLTPGLTVVPVVVSGVISSAALRNPIVHLRRRRRDQEWLAATLQMLVPALRNVSVQVEFGRPIPAGESSRVGDAVLDEARRLMLNGGAG